MGAKLTNKTDMVGPYPGRTWEEEAEAARSPNGGEPLFGFHVFPKIKAEECDFCREKCSPEYQYCSKECADNFAEEIRIEAEWEARVS